jgi:hypothetical protein
MNLSVELYLMVVALNLSTHPPTAVAGLLQFTSQWLTLLLLFGTHRLLQSLMHPLRSLVWLTLHKRLLAGHHKMYSLFSPPPLPPILDR